MLMRYSLGWIIGSTALLVPCMSSDFAFAEGEVKSQASQITVTGVRCMIPPGLCSASKKQSRMLILQSTQTELSDPATGVAKGKPPEGKMIQGFRIVPTDLERKDGLAFVPAKWVKAKIDAATSLAPQKYIAVPIQFDLKQVPASGEYAGSLIVENSGGDLSVPVTLKVKDSCHLALPFLVAGVLLAFALSAYQAEGFDRDEMTVKVGQLRSQMRSEAEETTDEGRTAQSFQAKAESFLVDVSTYLDAKTWAEARKSFADAQVIWDRWRKQRSAWVDLREYIQQALASHVGKEILADSAYGKDLKFEIDRLNRDMADSETPRAFSALLKPLKEKVQQFLAAKSEYEKLNEMRNQMGTEGDRWQQSLIELDDRLNRISLDEQTGLEDWLKAAKDLGTEMQQAHKETASIRGRSSWASVQPVIRSVPQILEQAEQKTAQQAGWRLQVFRWTGQGVAIALLCGAGFNQLYAANPIFGASPVADYTSLLAWGFTAEVTRDSVGKILQRFKLPAVGG